MAARAVGRLDSESHVIVAADLTNRASDSRTGSQRSGGPRRQSAPQGPIEVRHGVAQPTGGPHHSPVDLLIGEGHAGEVLDQPPNMHIHGHGVVPGKKTEI